MELCCLFRATILSFHPIYIYIYIYMLYTMRIHMQAKQYKYTSKNRWTLFCSVTNRSLISEFGSSTWGERQFFKIFHNHTMITTPLKFRISHGPISISQLMVGLQLLTIMVRLNFNCLPLRQTTQLSAYIVQLSFSKSSNSQDHHFWAWHHPHSSPISHRGPFMTTVTATSSACERKLYPMLCTWTKSRIVQSPTKLNDKI